MPRRTGVASAAALATVVLLLAIPACSDDSGQAGDTTTTTSVVPSPVTLTEGPDALAVVAETGRFSTFLGLVESAGLTDAVALGGPWTIFAPDDEALASLGTDVLDELRADSEAARAFVLAHVVAGVWRGPDLQALNGQTLTTEAATTISFTVTDGVVTVGGELEGAVVVEPLSIEAANAVIHAVEQALPAPG